jgi:predicted transcriptional regulator
VVERLNITVDDDQYERLARMAERMHLQPGTLARSLLLSALDDAALDAENVVRLLDGLPDAYERAELGRRQAEAGETVPLDDLA